MTIPVQWYDDDFFIGVTLKDALALCIPTPEAVEKARLKLAEAFDVDGQNAEPIRAGVDSETN